MTHAVFVLAHEPPAAAGPALAPARERLRDTLEHLWSEEPGAPARVIVHAGPELARVARREHGRRVEVWPADERLGWADTLTALADAARQRWLVWLRLGARVTPGWLHELAHVLPLDGAMVGPRLPLGAGTGAQAAHVPQSATRSVLREAATRVRFDEPRLQAVETLAAACVGIGQRSLARVGRFDARYGSLAAVLLDLQARLLARGGQLVVARRALVHATAEPSLPELDARALAQRHAPVTAPWQPVPPVAIELETDDPEHGQRAELAVALLVRGVDVHTFGCRTRSPERPTPAPHHTAATLAAATHGMALVLTRNVEPAHARARQLVLAGTATGPHTLAAPAATPLHDRPQRLDAWAREVEAAARAAGAEGEP